MLRLLPLAVLVGCPDDGTAEDSPSFSYPLDDVLTFADLQAVGTHNSYHQRTEGMAVEEWDYDHAALDVQLGEQGVRQFELDIWWDEAGGFDVYHVPLADQTSNCDTLTDCLETMRDWSKSNPAHHPLFTLLEVKNDFGDTDATALLADLDATVDAIWPRGERISPDDVENGAASVRAAVSDNGWPTLGELRGRALFVLHTDADYRQAYTEGDTTTAGRVLFPDAHGDLTLEVGAVSSMNDPADTEGIAAALAAGHLVRTRADSDTLQARENDTTQRDLALASGAHFVSTDFPVPHEETGYVVTMPGGMPSRCNPVTAPEECTSPAIEDPAFIGK